MLELMVMTYLTTLLILMHTFSLNPLLRVWRCLFSILIKRSDAKRDSKHARSIVHVEAFTGTFIQAHLRALSFRVLAKQIEKQAPFNFLVFNYIQSLGYSLRSKSCCFLGRKHDTKAKN